MTSVELNSNLHSSSKIYTPEDVDAALRCIASLPVPQGLEKRVIAALGSAPRHPRVIAWPARPATQHAWLRTAAATAIVIVVAGGGWGVYSHVRPAMPLEGAQAPPAAIGSHPAGFSAAGAMRSPRTLIGPAVPAGSAEPSPEPPKKLSRPATENKKSPHTATTKTKSASTM